MSKRETFLEKLDKVLTKKYHWEIVSADERKRLLKDIKWYPDLFYRNDSALMAIDINLSNDFPVKGADEILKATKKIKNSEQKQLLDFSGL